MKKRVLSSTGQTTVVNGRTYTSVPGTPLDVADFDADKLALAGWAVVGLSGPTASRPTTRMQAAPHFIGPGQLYYDTDINALLVFDGLVWRNPVTGALA